MAIEKLKKQEVFEFLLPEQLNVISEAAEVAKFKAGEMVYTRGVKADYFYIVLKGQVALRLPGKGALSIVIDELSGGDMFGGCILCNMDAYALNAQCVEDSEILKIRAPVLKRILDEDSRAGYMIQSRISGIYFKRYIDTMEKLQAIIMSIPV